MATAGNGQARAPIMPRGRALRHVLRSLAGRAGVEAMKIYTKTGDSGETSLFDNTRVSKADARVDAYGEVDELNACLGAARAAGVDEELGAALEAIQRDLFALGARLADPA